MKFLLTIFKESDLPKISHIGPNITVDYNSLYLMEEEGITPIFKELEVSRNIWDSVQYAPTECDKDKCVK